eukprot:Hpha_TRINITY_DN28178_c0_g1::TRINITY_DN28178_c0_g1_i1::g.103216::m.103216
MQLGARQFLLAAVMLSTGLALLGAIKVDPVVGLEKTEVPRPLTREGPCGGEVPMSRLLGVETLPPSLGRGCPVLLRGFDLLPGGGVRIAPASKPRKRDVSTIRRMMRETQDEVSQLHSSVFASDTTGRLRLPTMLRFKEQAEHYMSVLLDVARQREKERQPGPLRICEVGFGMGDSTLMWLASARALFGSRQWELITWDIFHGSGKMGRKFVRARWPHKGWSHWLERSEETTRKAVVDPRARGGMFAGRLNEDPSGVVKLPWAQARGDSPPWWVAVAGDTRVTLHPSEGAGNASGGIAPPSDVVRALEARGGCSVISIDGAHSAPLPLSDTLGLARAAARKHTVVWDDAQTPGVSEALLQLQKQGKVRVSCFYTSGSAPGGSETDWHLKAKAYCVGHYLK